MSRTGKVCPLADDSDDEITLTENNIPVRCNEEEAAVICKDILRNPENYDENHLVLAHALIHQLTETEERDATYLDWMEFAAQAETESLKEIERLKNDNYELETELRQLRPIADCFRRGEGDDAIYVVSPGGEA